MENGLPWNQSLVIIPTYNEVENIEELLRTLHLLYPELSFLVIDDNSPDQTFDVVKKLQSEFSSQLHLLQREGKQGLATAYITGFKWALERDYRFVFEMDSDFSHSPEELVSLLRAAQEADLVVGSRYIDGIRIMNWPFGRLLISYLAGIYIRFVTRIPLLDSTGGFKCFSRKALESLDLNRIISKGYIFQLELNYKVWKLGLNIVEVPITFHERKRGISKMGGKIVFEAFFRVLQLRWRTLCGSLL